MTGSRERLEEIASGFMQARVLITACELDLFSAIGGNQCTSAEVVAATGTSQAPIARVLDALAAMKILAKKSGRYRNTAAALRHLTSDAPEPLADIMRHRGGMWKSWSRLTGVARTGRVPKRERTPPERQNFIKAMTNVARLSAEETAAVLAPELKKARRLIDVGGGPGTYAYAFARKNPQLSVTIADLPDAIAIARGIAREAARTDPALRSLGRRVKFLPGDVLELHSLGRGHDVAFMSNFLHCFKPEGAAEVMRKASRSVRRGGWVIVKDFCLEGGGREPAFAALFSINMLVAGAGDSYSSGQYRRWMEEAGVKLRRREKIAKNSTLLVGEKV